VTHFATSQTQDGIAADSARPQLIHKAYQGWTEVKSGLLGVQGWLPEFSGSADVTVTVGSTDVPVPCCSEVVAPGSSWAEAMLLL
jgi:hypothetical protein